MLIDLADGFFFDSSCVLSTEWDYFGKNGEKELVGVSSVKKQTPPSSIDLR